MRAALLAGALRAAGVKPGDRVAYAGALGGYATERVIAADLVLIGCGWGSENGWGSISLAVSAATVAILLAALARGF